MKLNFKLTAVLVTAMSLSACAVQLPPDVGYVIKQQPDYVKQSRRHHHATLMVIRPDASPAYDTTRIAFTSKPFQISYYSASHWAETPSDMLMPLIVETLQKTHHYRAVILPPFTGEFTYALRTTVNELLIDYTKTQAMLNLTLQAQLLSGVNGNLVATHEFKVAVPLACRTPYSAVLAANRATALALSQLSVWVVKHT